MAFWVEEWDKFFDPKFALRRPKLERELILCCSRRRSRFFQCMTFLLCVAGFIPKMAAALQRDAFFRFGKVPPGRPREASQRGSCWCLLGSKTLQGSRYPSGAPRPRRAPAIRHHAPAICHHATHGDDLRAICVRAISCQMTACANWLHTSNCRSAAVVRSHCN